MEKDLDIDLEIALSDNEADSEKFNQANSSWPEQKTTEESTRQPRSTAYLDGLRGLAAFLVYLHHQVPWYYGPNGPIEHGFGYHGEMMFGTFPFIRTMFTGGSAAVSIFFVLSGYVLGISPLQLLHEGKLKQTYRSLLSAFIRRPFRLFVPPAGVSLIFALVIMHLPFGLAPHLEWPKPEPTVFAELAKWFREFGKMMYPLKKHSITESWFPYNPVAWTLAAEYKGSVVLFTLLGLFSLASTKHRMYLFGLTGLFTLMIREWAVACFMFGAVLAINNIGGVGQISLPQQFSKRTRDIVYIILFFAAWWLLGQPAGQPDAEFSYATPGWYYMTKILPRNYYNDEYWRFWNSIGAAMLVYSISNLKWFQSFLCLRSIQYLGKISFPLYLVHVPFEWTVGDRICRLLGVIRFDFTTWYDRRLQIPDLGPWGLSTGFLVFQMISIPLNLVLATWALHTLDQPGIRIGRWVVARLGLSSDKARRRRQPYGKQQESSLHGSGG